MPENVFPMDHYFAVPAHYLAVPAHYLGVSFLFLFNGLKSVPNGLSLQQIQEQYLNYIKENPQIQSFIV